MEQNLKQWYKDTRCENQIQGQLTPQRVRTTSDWPKVKAKAAQTRALAHYALYLVTTFGNMDNEEEKLAMGVATLLVEFYTIMSAEDMFLSDAARARLPRLGQKFAMLYSKLSIMSFQANTKFWKHLGTFA